jgi:hypothetical protein
MTVKIQTRRMGMDVVPHAKLSLAGIVSMISLPVLIIALNFVEMGAYSTGQVVCNAMMATLLMATGVVLIATLRMDGSVLVAMGQRQTHAQVFVVMD